MSFERQELRICEFAQVMSGGTPSTAVESYWNGDIGWITPADLSEYDYRYISNGDRNITLEGLNKSAACLLPENTVLLSSRAPIGYVAIAKNKLATNQGFKNLVCDENKVDYRYIYYWLKLNSETLKSFASGATFGELSARIIKKIKVMLPELKEQKKIADILWAFDDLIENNKKRIEILQKQSEEIYKEWFIHFRFPGHENTIFESGLPKDWDILKVKYILNRLPYGTLYKSENCVPNGKIIVIDQSLKEYVGFHDNNPSHIASIDKPIILFGDHSCKFQLMIKPFSLSENVIPFVGVDDYEEIYIYYLTHKLIETTEYKRHWTEFVSKKVIIAPIDLQKKFANLIKPNIVLSEKLKEQNRMLIKQRDMLLVRLLDGKLEISD